MELENAYFELEKQRSSLQQEVDALRQSLRDGPQAGYLLVDSSQNSV